MCNRSSAYQTESPRGSVWRDEGSAKEVAVAREAARSPPASERSCRVTGH